MSHVPLISVVVPTYNRVDRLVRILDALSVQTLPSDTFEVIVVSDGSTDGTEGVLEAMTTPFRLVVERQDNQGPAVARNRGIELATAALTLFLDDDVLPGIDLLRQHVEAHRRLGDGYVVIGTMTTPPDLAMSPWVRWEQRMLYKQYEAMLNGEWEPTARQFYTGNASVERRHLVDVGGFDASFRRAEDVELAYRLAAKGLRFAFEPTLLGFHYAERSFSSWLSNASAYGRNDVVFARDRAQSWLLPAIRSEYDRRSRLTRFLTTACLQRPGLGRILTGVITTAVTTAPTASLQTFSRFALSAIYNVAYYQGLSEELGSWEAFLQIPRSTADAQVPGAMEARSEHAVR